MKSSSIFAFLIFCLSACENKTQHKQAAGLYSTVSYLDLKLDEQGHLPSNPYFKYFKNGKKEILFCGVNHLSDPTNTSDSMYYKIECEFLRFHPQVAVNEGGDVSKRNYPSREQAIREDAEIGLTKFLSDHLKISTVNGDPTEVFEFSELQKDYTAAEVLTYVATERFMWGLKNSGDTTGVEEKYTAFVNNYLMKRGGLKLKSEEQSFLFFKNQYQKLLGRTFSFAELEPTNPFEPEGKFQAIGRRSKEIRDQFLMSTIDELLVMHDRVIVVFGGWHLLVCEPGLEEIIRKEKK